MFPFEPDRNLPSPGRRLRNLWASQEIVVIPGVYNAILARLVERAGFPAVYVSGAGVTNSLLGMPDTAFITLTEMAETCGHICRATSLPVVADADTGYGEALQAARAVQVLSASGLAGIHLEDQAMPKRCGHLEGKEVVPAEQMASKIKAAAAAKPDPDFVIIARTDAKAIEGIESAIDRAKRYLDAGADAIFPEALTSRGEFERFARAVKAPLMANMTEFGKTPLFTAKEFAEMGYKMAIFPQTLFRVMMKAAESALAALSRDGGQASLIEQMQTRTELYDLLSYPSYEEFDRRMGG